MLNTNSRRNNTNIPYYRRPKRNFNIRRNKNRKIRNRTNINNNYRKDEYYFNRANLNQRRTIDELRKNDKTIVNKIANIDKKLKDVYKNNKVTQFNDPKKYNRKEPRRDKIITAMNMGLTSRYISIFPTSNRITYQKIYNRFEVISSQGTNRSFIWFPYAVNFNSYPELQITVDDGNSGTVAPDMISSLVMCDVNPYNQQVISSYQPKDTTPCGIPGTYRLICASLKITNTTPMLNRGGSYIIYKLNENVLYPPFYNHALLPSMSNSPNYGAELGNVVLKNHDQINIKQSYSASDIAYIHEFNVYEGNNIFQGTNEYIGEDFISGAECVAAWMNNPSGNNIKYLIDIPMSSTQNDYIIETWQIIEVVPHPSLNLDNITTVQSGTFSKNVIDKLKTYNPLKIKRL